MSIHSGSHLILGSTSIQLMDMSAPEKRQIVADDSQEDESLHDPPLHLVRFGPKGRVVSASVESNTVKLWPSLAQNTGHRAFVESCLKVGEEKSFGTIYRYEEWGMSAWLGSGCGRGVSCMGVVKKHGVWLMI